jgi:hypothetical protein
MPGCGRAVLRRIQVDLRQNSNMKLRKDISEVNTPPQFLIRPNINYMTYANNNSRMDHHEIVTSDV